MDANTIANMGRIVGEGHNRRVLSEYSGAGIVPTWMEPGNESKRAVFDQTRLSYVGCDAIHPDDTVVDTDSRSCGNCSGGPTPCCEGCSWAWLSTRGESGEGYFNYLYRVGLTRTFDYWAAICPGRIKL
jgi:hypothetical protein